MNNKQKIKIYKQIINYIKQHPFDDNFICLKLKHFCKYYENYEKVFEEFLLFRDNKCSAWIDDEMIFENEIIEAANSSEESYVVNARRVFILQLCIEMLK